MPTALSKSSSLFKKKVTVTPLIGGRRDSQLLTLIRLIAVPQKEGQPDPRSFLRFGYEVSFEALDKGAIEILGPYGISYTFRRLAERISQLQSGFVVRRVRYDPWPPAWWGRLLRCGEDIRGSSEWRFPCREPDEGRPSRPVRRAGISRPYYHYAFAMLLGSTLFVTFSRMWDSLSSWVDNRSSFILIVSSFYNNKSSQE
ncbi:hypothetical protein K1719_004972 [Acacia pycnantha]|nr:hypothetical protein K1719_004972 [Acacia pycnantha]